MCFAHMRPPPFAVTLSSQNDFYMFISVFIICFLLYHMSPRDSVMTCARISVPHLLEHFSLFLTFPPSRSFSSCPRLEQLPLFSLFCSNSLFLFLSAIGAASSFFSLLPQLASSLPVRNWSIFLCFLTFAPTRFSTFNPRLEHHPLFSLFCPNSLLHFLSAIGASPSFFLLLPQLSSIFAQPTLIDCKLLW